jgi:hypothetical protein
VHTAATRCEWIAAVPNGAIWNNKLANDGAWLPIIASNADQQ